MAGTSLRAADARKGNYAGKRDIIFYWKKAGCHGFDRFIQPVRFVRLYAERGAYPIDGG